ncbi:RNA 2',3'-cyclic phosphodiesterase [Streptosporangiaceae bacterium NEAU-GS5]|nr:RNA 2',3'-cyclic phosphodiesterase [Streptosporangiaceae bacterium NEAU-GS5]
MRLFVALLPPPEALAEIKPPSAVLPRLRWIDPALWHVTLAFLGEVPDSVRPELDVRLARAAARHAPMTLAFRGAGAFPSAPRGRVFWVGVAGELTRLAESVAAGAGRAGAGQVDRKRFHAHLTLARSREPHDLRPLVAEMAGFQGSAWQADAVHLVRSHLGPQVRYEPVAAYPLGKRD